MCGVFFFFQAEDGIRDDLVTGVQTCALPIYSKARFEEAVIKALKKVDEEVDADEVAEAVLDNKIGRASCRERV